MEINHMWRMSNNSGSKRAIRGKKWMTRFSQWEWRDPEGSDNNKRKRDVHWFLKWSDDEKEWDKLAQRWREEDNTVSCSANRGQCHSADRFPRKRQRGDEVRIAKTARGRDGWMVVTREGWRQKGWGEERPDGWAQDGRAGERRERRGADTEKRNRSRGVYITVPAWEHEPRLICYHLTAN